MSFNKANLRSVEYTTAQTFDADQRREYFFLYVTSGDVTIEFGDGGGLIPVPAGGHYEPLAIPTNKIVITPNPTAAFTVASDTHP